MSPTPTSTIPDFSGQQPAAPQPAVFGFRSSEGLTPPRSAQPIELAGRRTAPVKVVLQLPDLNVPVEAEPNRRAHIKNLVFWISIALGAMLALYLIVGGGHRRADAPSDEAPAWSAPTAPHIEAPATAPPAVGPAVHDGAAAPPDIITGPPEIRTAQRTDTIWDGTAPRAQPGGASPLGISTTVQP